MAEFKVNSGCLETEVCSLEWNREVEVLQLETSVFLSPASCVKNREERLVVLNRKARALLDEMRGIHS
jgi:hypothetical protein